MGFVAYQCSVLSCQLVSCPCENQNVALIEAEASASNTIVQLTRSCYVRSLKQTGALSSDRLVNLILFQRKTLLI